MGIRVRLGHLAAGRPGRVPSVPLSQVGTPLHRHHPAQGGRVAGGCVVALSTPRGCRVATSTHRKCSRVATGCNVPLRAIDLETISITISTAISTSIRIEIAVEIEIVLEIEIAVEIEILGEHVGERT